MRSLIVLGFLALTLVGGYDIAVASGGAFSMDPSMADAVQDYLAVRKVGLALAALAFLVALGKLGSSENPHERSRAQDTLVLSLVAFVILAGDRMIARGVVEWFGLTPEVLPPFWW